MNTDTPPPSQQDLPNAKLVKTLGILSFVVSLFAVALLCIGVLISIVNGISALQRYSVSKKTYNLNPENYTAKSYKRLRTGFYFAIAGLAISCIEIVVIVLNYGKDGLN